MWQPIQFILMMLYGQADVKSGFNINKEPLVENMLEASLISQQQIYDHMKSNNIESHIIKPIEELLVSVKVARLRYGIALEERENQIQKGHEIKTN